MLQWSKRKHELDQKGVGLVFVSIGTPEKGKILAEHLEIPDAENLLFVDPENVLYDAIRLRRGVDRTFFNIETPFAFVDRFTKPSGMKELGQVLSKWNKAFFIPPKQDQAFIQGGTFVFKGPKTLFAHYDPSTASHANMIEVIDTAVKAMNGSTASLQ
ncbi:hypothetical protein FisN_5Lh332 [Fistulifera solaris]|uniref:Uncharacterized protein n=1 Tax=Fistulifera solaris TaxID=1519565 RepID=A0A1Z5KG12_FISSO|nr:hypothetical protein FisN_5Lh332 [Fistulifera solaris]|eukprot:GAX25250.1 hypothetical protein FisN_5Lh332 [Fistulifera solaris]